MDNASAFTRHRLFIMCQHCNEHTTRYGVPGEIDGKWWITHFHCDHCGLHTKMQVHYSTTACWLSIGTSIDLEAMARTKGWQTTKERTKTCDVCGAEKLDIATK